ncbi:glycoprotein [Crithidia bombi leishbuvirus 1]|nr:glycoprotein [Crithidia bombi leishbuvirus 1]
MKIKLQLLPRDLSSFYVSMSHITLTLTWGITLWLLYYSLCTEARGLCHSVCSGELVCTWDQNCKCHLDQICLFPQKPSLIISEGDHYSVNSSYFLGQEEDINLEEILAGRLALVERKKAGLEIEPFTYWRRFTSKYPLLAEKVIVPVCVDLLKEGITATFFSLSHYLKTTVVPRSRENRGYNNDFWATGYRGYCANSRDGLTISFAGKKSFKMSVTGSVISFCFDDNGKMYGSPVWGPYNWEHEWNDMTCYVYRAGVEMVPAATNCVAEKECLRLLNPTYQVVRFHWSSSRFDLDTVVCDELDRRVNIASTEMTEAAKNIGDQGAAGNDICHRALSN